MVQLKQVALRLKSVKNIQKITKTMKMVSASKFTKAERELASARPFGYGPRKFYESSHLVKVEKKDDVKGKEPTPEPVTEKPDEGQDPKKTKRLYVAVTSDKGLCGGVHSGVSRRVRRTLQARKGEADANRLVCIGDKSRVMLRRLFAENMLVNVKDIGRLVPVFADASTIAAAIVRSGYTYDVGEIYYNKYFTPVKYEMTVIPFFNKYKIVAAPNMNAFDDVDEDELESYSEWTFAALLFYTLKESAASEQSSRMAAMDNATKNAEDMKRKLTLLFNRTRQAVITRELIEIISGAAAL
ncbi:ATP synthase subunit gamma, mitochondrial-like [Maniola hyperantus]|uniref:ATP synthase subunit gamma, mitochondrial-like n=1 Tax=Aphantopus hyperantus TaxID=2795564 RepID=UPI0015684F77|nr:ATP synthase subunit gamma, mitochondrial-like [Maniola hyperantus]